MTRVESIHGTAIKLADGTSFTLPLDDIADYGIVVSDQATISNGNGQPVVTIFRFQWHKADIGLQPNGKGFAGRIIIGKPKSKRVDPASPFSGDYRRSALI